MTSLEFDLSARLEVIDWCALLFVIGQVDLIWLGEVLLQAIYLPI